MEFTFPDLPSNYCFNSAPGSVSLNLKEQEHVKCLTVIARDELGRNLEALVTYDEVREFFVSKFQERVPWASLDNLKFFKVTDCNLCNMTTTDPSGKEIPNPVWEEVKKGMGLL